MIGKVTRGSNVRRLLYYLYGPGKANEHTDPHLVAGFGDPAELEPERLRGGYRDFRRLAGLLNQPLAAVNGDNYPKPVWHCSVRAAPDDRLLSDAEWARVAAHIMHRTGLAPDGDDLGVRWVAVRHAPDHIHLVATLARQDRHRPSLWNSYRKLRDACRDTEEWFGLRSTPPADRTAARRPTRAETEQAARRGQDEPARVRLRREVCTAAAGARTEDEFFAHLAEAGVLVRRRYSTQNPGQVTGYAVGLPGHTARDGQVVWFGGGKLAADLTLPKLRARWAGPHGGDPLAGAAGLAAPAVRAVLRSAVAAAAEQAAGEQEFFARLRSAGVLVRERFSELNPGEVTGYAVALPGCTGPDGTPRWHGGGRLHDSLTLPRLRQGWAAGQREAGRSGAFRFTAPERAEIYRHAARQAAAAAEHLRHCTAGDPGDGADAAWAAADTLHAAARATGSPGLRCAADRYDRAARAPYGRIPGRYPARGSVAGGRAAARDDRPGRRAGHGPGGCAGREPDRADRGGSRAAGGPGARRAGGSRPEGRRAVARRLHPGPAAGATSGAGPRPSGPAGGPAGRAQADFPLPLTEVVNAAAAQDPAGQRSRPHVAQPPARARPAR